MEHTIYTDDDHTLHLVYESTAANLVDVHKKMIAALDIGLRTQVEPIRIDGGNALNPKDRYRLSFYSLEKK